jgi:hypothetical protein
MADGTATGLVSARELQAETARMREEAAARRYVRMVTGNDYSLTEIGMCAFMSQTGPWICAWCRMHGRAGHTCFFLDNCIGMLLRFRP